MAILSIYKETDFIKAVLLIPEKNLFRILFLKEYSLESFEACDLLYTIKKETGLNYKDLDVISPLETKSVSIKKTSLPFKNKQKISKALSFFSLENFYFKKETLIVSPLTALAKRGSDSYLYATSKHLIAKHTKIYDDLDLSVDSLSCVPAALSSFAYNFCDTSMPVFVIHVGFDQLNMVLVSDNFSLNSFSYSIGLKDFIDVLLDNDFAANKIDADLIQEIIETVAIDPKNQHPLQRQTNILKQTIERFIDSCLQKEKLEKPIHLLFTGYGFIIEKIFCLNNYCIAPETTKHHLEYDTFTLKRYAIELGSALQLTKFSKYPLLFPISLASDQKSNKKIKSLAKISATCMLAFFSTLFILSSLTLSKQERKINHAMDLIAKKMHLQEQFRPNDSIQDRMQMLKKNHTKELLKKARAKKAPCLASTLKALHKSIHPIKMDRFSYQKEKDTISVSFKLQSNKGLHQDCLANLKKTYQKNLVTLNEKNGTVEYTLKY